MGLFSGVTSFLSRHKRKFIYLGTAAVAFYAGKSWLASKVSELHDKAGAEKTKKEGYHVTLALSDVMQRAEADKVAPCSSFAKISKMPPLPSCRSCPPSLTCSLQS